MKMPTPDTPLKIGTRGSPLAIAQAEEARTRLADAHGLPFEAFTIVVIKTTGDRIIDRPLKEIGGKGLFTREIEAALSEGEIDLAVHSMKDMPTLQPEGLVLDTYLPREDPRDAFVALDGGRLPDLPEGRTVGTSSLRRRAQLLYRRPDLQVVEFRGNVQTRLRKLADGVAHATFLAMAGLNRLNDPDVPRSAVSEGDMLPAVAQGAIGIERRMDDDRLAEMLAAIHDRATGERMAAERSFLATLDGSCETPIAGLAEFTEDGLRLRGEILRTDGTECHAGEISGPVADGADLGAALARDLLSRADDDFFDWKTA